MKLKARYAYDVSPERYWEMYWDDAFDAKLQEGSNVEREVLSEKDEGGVLTRRLRFTPDTELPKPVAAILGSDKLVWEQVNHWHRDESNLAWEVLPTFISADKFKARGDFRVVPEGTGCVVEIDGDIDVNVRFIGGRVESQVVSQIQAAYDNMHRVATDWLDGEGSNS